MSCKRTSDAVMNNVAWCEAVCGAQGTPGELLEGAWVNRHETPRFYPNVVSVTDDQEAVRHVDDLLTSDLSGDWGVKDSYGTLALDQHPFAVLFEGRWVSRTPNLDPGSVNSTSDWVRVEDTGALARWEKAWTGDASHDLPRVFCDGLLDDDNVAFLAMQSAGQIVGGLIASRSDEVVGISNLFGTCDTSASALEGGLAAVDGIFPALPHVGYEPATRTGILKSAGFEMLGTLRVWIREAG